MTSFPLWKCPGEKQCFYRLIWELEWGHLLIIAGFRTLMWKIFGLLPACFGGRSKIKIFGLNWVVSYYICLLGFIFFTCLFLVCWFQQQNGAYTVGDFMTKKEALYVVKTTTSVDEGFFITRSSVCPCYEQFYMSAIFGWFSSGDPCGEENNWLSGDWRWLESGNICPELLPKINIF